MQIPFPRLTSPLVGLLSIAACAIALCAFGADRSDAAGRYVAFGDSGTTGSGLGAESVGSRSLCWQTDTSYPVYLRSALSFSSFATAACSAAWTNDLTTDQSLYNPTLMAFTDTAPPQFNALNGTEELITISIGDNDSGYGDIVSTCLDAPAASTPCADSSSYNNFVNRANAYLSDALGPAIDEAHRRSPNAEVWVIGYPRLIPENISNCPGRVDLSVGDAPIVNDWQKAVNNVQKAITEARDAYYVDVFSQSDGHDSCQPVANDRWTNPKQSATPSGWSHHPTAAGHQAVANLFVNAFNSPRPIRPVKPDPDGKVSTPIGQSLKIAFGAKKVRAATSRLAPITTKAPPKNGAKLSVTLARSGTVQFYVERAKAGHVKNGKCRSLSKSASKGRKACTRYVSVSSASLLALPGGSSTVYFTGRAAGKRLSAGKYRVRAALGSLSAKTRTFSLSR